VAKLEERKYQKKCAEATFDDNKPQTFAFDLHISQKKIRDSDKKKVVNQLMRLLSVAPRSISLHKDIV
jgi:hypothetical protein